MYLHIFYTQFSFIKNYDKIILGDIMYNLMEKAIHFATIAHSGQRRRNENVDVIFHPYTVGMILLKLGCSEEIVCSGILHDIIEDTNYDYEDLKNNFGIKIANNVKKVSEDSNIDNWRTRKESFINQIKDEEKDIITLEIVDKLHNLLSEYERFKKGVNIWSNSPAGYEDNKWFYEEIYFLGKNKNVNKDLLDRYKFLMEEYFGGNYE